MKAWHIALIVCGGLLLLFILFIVFIRISNRKRFNRLQENLKKLEREKDDFENDKRISLVDPAKIVPENSEAVIEDYQPEPSEDLHLEELQEEKFELPKEEFPMFDMEEETRLARKKHDAEFESFMEEHAFSRKILDKNLIDKLKKLPPEIQAVILNNVLDKFDD